MTLNSDANFEEKLTFCLKNDMRNLVKNQFLFFQKYLNPQVKTNKMVVLFTTLVFQD